MAPDDRHTGTGLRARRAGATLAFGLALVLIAFLFDAAPLFVPGVGLALIGAAAPVWVLATARGASAQRVLATERIVESEPLEAIICVRRGPLGLPGAEVVDTLTSARLSVAGPLSPIRGDREANVRVVARLQRRGLHELPPPTLLVADPLELARLRTARGGAAQRVLVLPRTEPVRWLSASRGRRPEHADGGAASEAMAATDVDGLRPYRPGTPASRIHWPAVARGSGLIERRLAADGDSRPLVVLDTRERPGADGTSLDAAVRAAASLALSLARLGGCALLLGGEQRPTMIDPELMAWPAAHARLAQVQATSRGPATAALHRSGPVVYVAAGPVKRLAAGLQSSGRGQLLLVVPHAELREGRPGGGRGRMLPVLEVSGCRGFALGAGRERERARGTDAALATEA